MCIRDRIESFHFLAIAIVDTRLMKMHLYVDLQVKWLQYGKKNYVGAVDRLQNNTDLNVPIFIRYVCAQTCNLLAYNAS